MSVKHVDGTNSKKKVFLYALSTCPWCKKTKALLDELKVKYDFLYVDLAAPSEQGKIIEELSSFNPNASFPTLLIDKKVIIGYEPEEVKAALA